MLQGGNINLEDVVTQLAMGVRATMQLNETLKALTRLSGGSFTMANAATKVVADPNVTASSYIILQATNSHAADLQAGAKALYISAKTAGTSFTVATQDGNAAVGDEEFDYIIYNPV